MYNHIKNSISSRLRISKYLIENLKADEYIEKIEIKALLKVKRNPVDTKSIHGRFGMIKIEKILKEYNFINLNSEVKEKSIEPSILLKKEYSNKFCYCTEKEINGIVKKNDNKPKKFDFILFIDGKIEYLVETNFYSTSGTKIGINQNEYIDLKNDIKSFNNKNKTNFKFIWITDGNYWLTKEGENRYNNLKNNHFTKDYELLNYNLLKEYLKNIK